MPEWLQRILETPPAWIVAIGYVLAAVVIVQVLVGCSRASSSLGCIPTLAWLIVGFATLHVVLATVHLLTG
jgi:hypothetical protein